MAAYGILMNVCRPTAPYGRQKSPSRKGCFRNDFFCASHNLFLILEKPSQTRHGWYLVSAAKVFPGFTLLQDRAAKGGFAKNLPLSLRTSVFSAKVLSEANPEPFKLLKPDTIHTGSATAYKKKSKVMRSTEKNKKWNQKTSALPLGIGTSWLSWLKFGAVALGFYLFGSGFVWVVLAFPFCHNILRGILSCLFSFVVLIGLFSFLLSRIF